MQFQGEQFAAAPGGIIKQSGEHVSARGLPVNIPEFCGPNQGVHRSGAPGRLHRIGQASNCDGPLHALGGTVRDAQAAIVDESESANQRLRM